MHRPVLTSHSIGFLIPVLICLTGHASPQNRSDSSVVLEKYVGKAYIIRHFYQDSKLEYDADGTVTGTPHPGVWTHARVLIKKAETTAKGIRISGRRAGDIFNKQADRLVTTQLHGDVTIEISLSKVDPETTEAVLHKVFVMSADELIAEVPSYWLPYLDRDTGGTTSTKLPDQTGPPEHYGTEEAQTDTTAVPQSTSAGIKNPSLPYRVGGRVKAPHAESTPDPRYDPIAKSERYEGTVVLRAVIDEQGRPQDLTIVRPAGLGLDEQAIESVSHWSFKPATRDGQPVKVVISIEVNFRLP